MAQPLRQRCARALRGFVLRQANRILIEPAVFPAQRPSSPWIHAAVVEPHPRKKKPSSPLTAPCRLINQSPRDRAQACSIL